MKRKTGTYKSNPVKKEVVTTGVLCNVVRCSSSMVRRVKMGHYTGESDLVQKIQVAEVLLNEGFCKVMTEVSNLLNPTPAQ